MPENNQPDFPEIRDITNAYMEHQGLRQTIARRLCGGVCVWLAGGFMSVEDLPDFRSNAGRPEGSEFDGDVNGT